MKKVISVLIAIIIIACKDKPVELEQKFIEPSKYNLAGYTVQESAYIDHDSVKYYRERAFLEVRYDSIFELGKEFGDFIFGGHDFKYQILDDSLYLKNTERSIKAHKINKLDANFFSVELDNKYFKRIGFIKPKDKRRRIIKTVDIEY